MSKQVVEKEKNEVVVGAALEDWGMGNNMTSDDLVIPKVWAMQKTSAMVDSDEASFGDLINSITKETLGTFDNGIDIIPVWMYKTWLTTENGKFVSISDAHDPNERPYEENGMRNEFCYNFYALVVGQGEIPFVITFKGKSRNTGKQLATQMYVLNRAAKLPPCGTVMKLWTHKDSNDKGTFATLKVRPDRVALAEESANALYWFKEVSKKAMNVDDRDITGDTSDANVETEEF